MIKINQQRYAAHRLAFLYVLGKLPNKDIDHIDRRRDNNAWSNLRDVDKYTNMQNVDYRVGVSGVRGVCRTKNGKRWQVQMSVRGVKYNFGQYTNLYDAEEVAIIKRKQLVGE